MDILSLRNYIEILSDEIPSHVKTFLKTIRFLFLALFTLSVSISCYIVIMMGLNLDLPVNN